MDDKIIINPDDLKRVYAQIMSSPMERKYSSLQGGILDEFYKKKLVEGLVEEMMKNNMVNVLTETRGDGSVCYKGELLIYKKKSEE